MVNAVRRIIDDDAYETIWEIKEDIGASSGATEETYYALQSPIVSGCAVRMRAGRTGYRSYYYTLVTAGEADKKQFTFDYTEGGATVPSGCTIIPSGHRIYLSYAWEAEKDQLYPDDQIWLYMVDAATDIKKISKHTYDFSGSTLAGAAISATPSEPQGWLIVLQTALNILEKDQRRFIRNALVIRHDDLSYDNTRGGTIRLDTIKELRNKLGNLINAFLMGEMSGSKIDVYSTKDFGTNLIGYWQEDEEW